MANYYDTSLVCKSNNQLLKKMDPRDIIKNPNSEFITYKNGFYFFSSCNDTMHESILELSKTFPTEVFVTCTWNVDVYDSEIQTYEYKDGKSKCIKTEPNYGYCISHVEKIMGNETSNELMEVVMRYIKQYRAIEDSKRNKKIIQQELMKKIRSSTKIIVENKKFKIEATRVGSSFIEVEGYIKETPSPIWTKIEREKNRANDEDINDSLNVDASNIEEYDDLPF
jgi:hypothetical protein